MAKINPPYHALREYNKQSILSLMTSNNKLDSLISLTDLHHSALYIQQALEKFSQAKSSVERNESKELQHNLLVEKVAKEVYDNLLFTGTTNEIIQKIKDELSEREGESYLFKYQVITRKIRVYQKYNKGLIEIVGEEKAYILETLWDITLKVVGNTMQSISNYREMEMNIKRSSSTTSNYVSAGTSKPSSVYSSAQVISTPSTAIAATHDSDTITVSSEGVLRTEAFQAAMSAAEIRQEKIQKIKAKLSEGSYIIDTKKLAFNLLREEASLFTSMH